MKEEGSLAAVEQTDNSESQVQHESLLSHGCEEGTHHRGCVRSFVLLKASEAFSLLPVLVNPSLLLFLFWMLRFEERANSRKSMESSESGQSAGDHEE